ncbi:Sulfite exporter TauE/SafE [uncultured Ruminococcus sp.]|uniref:Probable membrane transporter protein n=1 Tax=Massiliimalia timonensis TaxID=1987501 RepID=A0A8J6PCH6_9FIRM|nr:sulfite exporter TauE/SafE family protein [Massiliimalia timonensis]MBC8609961.1 sulfite exporter TauE/SafE family protein [Massiliimalia timonensis]SCH16996.1 Sulfite exporter TauE/SafE [uncultured Ruminococcus sp.]SCH23520.1 Sulfite exporter TauE/SafE [uncultured Clostridium sp.]
MNNIFLILAGLLSGICASMGLGGGFVLLVYLTMFTQLSQLESQLTNLVFFLPIATISILLHLKNHLIEKKVLWKAIITGVAGVIVGYLISRYLPEEWISKLFGAFILWIGARELFHKKADKQAQKG